jgi:4-amino-4-deoxy-L-arabinose transferase-like glycosyltransferase
MRMNTNRSYRWLLTGVLILYALLLLAGAQRFAAPWDSGTMVAQGVMLAENHGLQYYDINNERISPYFHPMGFEVYAPHQSQPYSTFPPGYPLLIAVVYRLTGGLGAVYLLNPGLGLLGLIAAAYIGWTLGGPRTSLLTVILLGTSFVFFDQSTVWQSDGPSLSLLLISVALYQAAYRQRRNLLAVLCGLCLGLFIAIRFINVAYAALILVHALYFARGRERWWLVGWISPGVILGIVGMLMYQAQAYGGPLTSAYVAWGNDRYGVPLFSLRYLLERSPAPWNDYTLNAIVTGLVGEMGLWVVVALIGLAIDRRNPWRLLLGAIILTTLLIYGLSVFTPRANMRYMLPALAPAYILAADVTARVIARLRPYAVQVAALVAVGVISFGQMSGYWPTIEARNAHAAHNVQTVEEIAQSLPDRPVVLSYWANDLFALYSNASVLNYRKVDAPSLAVRNQHVIQAIQQLHRLDQRVYLIRDDERMFNTLYPALEGTFEIVAVQEPWPTFEIRPRF